MFAISDIIPRLERWEKYSAELAMITDVCRGGTWWRWDVRISAEISGGYERRTLFYR
jgi:hypothetical protein